ncbi:hypothetical protein [Oceanospirillum linum]|uniref:Uncharacterized protein n=1 Tax=Oceanospirillum linum TaxID=966 RepID=A0A1T1HE44_OCELI|nr:hypothetical protein [Oceanospirillum linum]OOV88138.1 hypothetical protein BTA35_0200885 [Oceanospirillum linum]SEF44460.1 hypothetical protein SAMN04489856_101181 [Oleiphilus messinensis]SMP01585.1 hypothetical protein SAMN06264348_101182 [Oceanospirillum linum]
MGDILADIYTPLLAAGVFWMLYRSGFMRAGAVFLPVSLLLVFIFSALDTYFGFWKSWGLDFSTHSAILIPFYQMLLVLMFLPDGKVSEPAFCWRARLRQGAALIAALISGVGYGMLMIELDYHTLADILTTLISIYPLVWICFHLLRPVAFANNLSEEQL